MARWRAASTGGWLLSWHRSYAEHLASWLHSQKGFKAFWLCQFCISVRNGPKARTSFVHHLPPPPNSLSAMHCAWCSHCLPKQRFVLLMKTALGIGIYLLVPLFFCPSLSFTLAVFVLLSLFLAVTEVTTRHSLIWPFREDNGRQNGLRVRVLLRTWLETFELFAAGAKSKPANGQKEDIHLEREKMQEHKDFIKNTIFTSSKLIKIMLHCACLLQQKNGQNLMGCLQLGWL